MDISDLLAERIVPDLATWEAAVYVKKRVPLFQLPVSEEAWNQRAADLRRQALAKVYLRGIPETTARAQPRVEWNAGYVGLGVRTHCAEDIGDLEQVPTDLCTVLDYTHMTAMRALRPDAGGSLLTEQLPESLKSLIDEGRKYSECPSLFCFGLLEDFDIPWLQAMVEG